MARGWESKAVEAQMEEAEKRALKQKPLDKLTPEERPGAHASNRSDSRAHAPLTSLRMRPDPRTVRCCKELFARLKQR